MSVDCKLQRLIMLQEIDVHSAAGGHLDLARVIRDLASLIPLARTT
jgi:hypothetical protein